MQVVVVVPARREKGQRFPVLVTMHGRGEALKGATRGARGWVDDYWLPQALERLRHPPLTRRDFLEMVAPERLERLNGELSRRSYEGLVVVCPYTPDRLAGDLPFERARPLAEFLVDELLPRVRSETPALAESRHTGIDGVSLGGRASLLVGLLRPEAFGVVATIQPAFDVRETSELASRAGRAVRRYPELRFRLVTSSRDYYLESTRTLARVLRAAGVEPNLLVLRGDHSYDFNRGPGVLEMLLFHDRALRGMDWP
jgi:enterochelin esterase-like enzyme